MLRSTLYITFLAGFLTIIHGQRTSLNGAPELPSTLNLDFPPPVPNAPDLQRAGIYDNNSGRRLNGRLSGALANQNMIMDTSGGLGTSFNDVNQNTAFGQQTGLGMDSGFSQSTGANMGLSSMGSMGINSDLGTPSGSMMFGEHPTALDSMGVNSGFGDVSSTGLGQTGFGLGGSAGGQGSLGDVTYTNFGDSDLDLPSNAGLTLGQGTMSTRRRGQPAYNAYMPGLVPGARGEMRRNLSGRRRVPLPIIRPPPIILLPPKRNMFSLFNRRPRVITVPLVPVGQPVPVPIAPRPF
ncbi:filaggrin-2-like [Saccostrea echinata]|uniref:filaggrin-2-like n=1 Tax=Saccostrea echinata TaxID=191078 RepID=UPI002A80C7EF|nr:filaggrin-2-like [Saccostrea echinata]